MTTDELYVMKLKFQAYNANVRLFNRAMQRYEQVLYEMNGVKAVSWGKIGRKESLDNFSRVIAMMPKKDRAYAELQDIYRDIITVENCYGRIEESDKTIVADFYFNGMKQKDIATKYSMEQKQVERRINRAIRNAL